MISIREQLLVALKFIQNEAVEHPERLNNIHNPVWSVVADAIGRAESENEQLMKAADTVVKTLEAAESSISAFEPLLPSQKLVDHAKWQRREIRKTLAMLEGKE